MSSHAKTDQPLSEQSIAFLATDFFEQVELEKPWQAVKEAGGKPVLVSLEQGKISGSHHADKGDSFNVDQVLENCSADDFDALILPGGVHNPDALRVQANAVQFVKDFFDQHKPVAAICHGPWMLVEADVVRGRTLTSWPSLQTDIKNAGGHWEDKEVVVDDGLITSRNPDDLNAFCQTFTKVFSQAKQANSEFA